MRRKNFSQNVPVGHFQFSQVRTCLCTFVSCSKLFSKKEIFCFCAWLFASSTSLSSVPCKENVNHQKYKIKPPATKTTDIMLGKMGYHASLLIKLDIYQRNYSLKNLNGQNILNFRELLKTVNVDRSLPWAPHFSENNTDFKP